ncbi:MAG: HU family DNA-binding protein [Calditrichaeota bacterium]|nr:HU family DNA-binding protein [Calditrichota bacterium]
MTNKELIAAIAAKTALSPETSKEVLQTVVETIQDAVWDGDRVTISDFGSFYLAERKARTGRNPRTGEAMELAASKHPKFIPAKKFKDMVR